MASYTVDQAEGLRKLLDKQDKSKIVTVFSVVNDDLRDGTLLNLGSALAKIGNKVLILDASHGTETLPKLVCADQLLSLTDIVEQKRKVYDAVKMVPQGFAFSYLYKKGEALPVQTDKEVLSKAFDQMAGEADITFVRGELNVDDTCPLHAMEKGDVILQVSPSRVVIQDAYLMLKRLRTKFVGDSFGILISDSTEQEAENMFKNLQSTARRYLALDLYFVGSIQKDEHIRRSMQPGHSLLKDFPRALSVQAFMQIANKIAADYVAPHASVGSMHVGA